MWIHMALMCRDGMLTKEDLAAFSPELQAQLSDVRFGAP
jgi:hypothetical protein